MPGSTVPLSWSGRFENFGGPLASGDTDQWVGWGFLGQENRFYQFTAFCDGSVAADIEVTNVSHYRRLDNGTIVDETHFDIHNKGSDAPVMYYFYSAWSDPINV
ncbi:MAG TPA: hypothetical protein VHT68_12135 [Pseudolabrys sp.]|jgi:hypothetical protein|nr:hypothetical protein [Pseudolabrys sp.]